MSKSEAKDGAPKENGTPKKRASRFVPSDEVPGPGLSQRAREVLAVALCGFALYVMLCLSTFRIADLDAAIPSGDLQNLGGAVGYHIAHGLTRALGLAGWVPFVLLLGASVWLFLGKKLDRPTIKALGTIVFAAMLAILFAGADGQAGFSPMTPYGAGGRFGQFASPRLESAFGNTGRLLIVSFGALMALMIATEWLVSQLVVRTIKGFEAIWRRSAPAAAGAGALVSGEPHELPVSRRRAASSNGVATPARATVGGDDDEDDDEVPRSRRRRNDADDPAAPSLLASAPETQPRAAESLARAAESLARAAEPVVELPKVQPKDTPKDPTKDAPNAAGSSASPAPPEPPPIVVLKPKSPKPKPQAKTPARKKAGQTTLPFDDYPFPPIELFREPQLNDATTTADVLTKGGQAILSKLANFGIQAEIVAASVGPAVTQYELRLAESIRVNKVVGFESDLAAALKAVSVRVVAPIPGKDTIGVEVPNPERQKVFMRDLLDQFGRSEELAIPLYLGKDVAGNPIVEDLARMPHLLIAGTTGSGKSVCINTILLSILMTRTPEQVKLILIDPKMVELQAYKRVPHLCCDVVTSMKKAPSVLQWAVDEMEMRYALLSGAGVNHVRTYNRLGQQELQRRLQKEPDPERVQLPYIVIVIDEFADLMNVAQNEVEDLIQRLAQKSRAVGMHVIVATQRPSSEVITGIIKANLPTQIAFKVNRRIDSRVILDANGAEKLLGYGDMLYMPPGGGALLRAQGTFVADDELQAVVRFLDEHGQEPQFNPALVQTQSSSRPSIADRDELYREAVEVILGQQRGSATLLQRALAVGYTRATRLLELMEADGLVGPFVGSKSRDVLLTLDEWKAREAANEQAAEDAAVGGGDGVSGEAAPGDDEREPLASAAESSDEDEAAADGHSSSA